MMKSPGEMCFKTMKEYRAYKTRYDGYYLMKWFKSEKKAKDFACGLMMTGDSQILTAKIEKHGGYFKLWLKPGEGMLAMAQAIFKAKRNSRES